MAATFKFVCLIGSGEFSLRIQHTFLAKICISRLGVVLNGTHVSCRQDYPTAAGSTPSEGTDSARSALSTWLNPKVAVFMILIDNFSDMIGGNEARQESLERREREVLLDKGSAMALLISDVILLLLTVHNVSERSTGGSPPWVIDLLLKVGDLAAVGGLFWYFRQVADRASRLARTAGARRSLR